MRPNPIIRHLILKCPVIFFSPPCFCFQITPAALDSPFVNKSLLISFKRCHLRMLHLFVIDYGFLISALLYF